MRIGFTGTRRETTCEQHRALCQWVQAATVTEFHYGCCIGADSEAFDAVTEYAPKAKTVAHPPTNEHLACTSMFADETLPALPYLDRNRAIVDACDVLVACPKGMAEERRSGTWATIRFARKRGKRVVVIWPDGTISD